MAYKRVDGAPSYAHPAHAPHHAPLLKSHARLTQFQGTVMGKYLVGWVLGVPAIVLVVLYIVFR